jgi:hypothetical protein
MCHTKRSTSSGINGESQHDGMQYTNNFTQQKKQVFEVVPGFFSMLGNDTQVSDEEMSYRTGVIRILNEVKI